MCLNSCDNKTHATVLSAPRGSTCEAGVGGSTEQQICLLSCLYALGRPVVGISIGSYDEMSSVQIRGDVCHECGWWFNNSERSEESLCPNGEVARSAKGGSTEQLQANPPLSQATSPLRGEMLYICHNEYREEVTC